MARKVALDAAAFCQAPADAPAGRHIRDTRALMRRYGLQGFPSFLLQRKGAFQPIQHDMSYGHPDAFASAIHTMASEDQHVPDIRSHEYSLAKTLVHGSIG